MTGATGSETASGTALGWRTVEAPASADMPQEIAAEWSGCALDELFRAALGFDERPAAAPPQPLTSQLTAWAQPHDPGLSPATALRAVLTWSRLHGIVSLEIDGNFASMGLDPGQLFEAELATLMTHLGGPRPAGQASAVAAPRRSGSAS